MKAKRSSPSQHQKSNQLQGFRSNTKHNLKGTIHRSCPAADCDGNRKTLWRELPAKQSKL